MFVTYQFANSWSIENADCDALVRYGRLGSFGQNQTNSFSDPAAAGRHAEKLIGEKTAKGYVETAVA